MYVYLFIASVKTMDDLQRKVSIVVNYDVIIDRKNNKFVIRGPIEENAIPIEIPKDNPLRDKRGTNIKRSKHQIRT